MQSSKHTHDQEHVLVPSPKSMEAIPGRSHDPEVTPFDEKTINICYNCLHDNENTNDVVYKRKLEIQLPSLKLANTGVNSAC